MNATNHTDLVKLTDRWTDWVKNEMPGCDPEIKALLIAINSIGPAVIPAFSCASHGDGYRGYIALALSHESRWTIATFMIRMETRLKREDCNLGVDVTLTDHMLQRIGFDESASGKWDGITIRWEFGEWTEEKNLELIRMMIEVCGEVAEEYAQDRADRARLAALDGDDHTDKNKIVVQRTGSCFTADFVNMPGSPQVGRGDTEMAALIQLLATRDFTVEIR